MKQFKICLSESVLCLQEVCTAFLLHAWNVLVTFAKPKKQLTRVCSGHRHLSSHLIFTRAIMLLPRSQCLCSYRRRSGKGKPKIFLPFGHSKAWDFSDEEIASLLCSPVTGSKYSVVDRTYTPTARRRPPCRQCSPGLVTTSSRPKNKLGERLW